MLFDLPNPPVIASAAPTEQPGESKLGDIRAARLRGDFDGARAEIRSVLAAEPNNADAWLEMGLVSLAAGDDANAQAAFLRTLDIAPGYDDAKLGLARLFYRRGDLAQARSWLSSVSASRGDDVDVETMRALLAPHPEARGAWRLDAMAAYSSLSNGLEPWRETMVTISRRQGTRSFGATLDGNDRFGQSDLYGEVSVAQATQQGTWGLAVGGAPDAHFMPRASVRADFVGRQYRHWSVDGTLSLARYKLGEVECLRADLTRYVSDWRIQARAIVVHDEVGRTRSGYGAGIVWGDDDAPQFSLNWTHAPESSEGATVDVQSVALGFAFNLSEHVRLHFGGAWEERDTFDRSEVSLALTRTF